jgi:hypothetical protein
MKIKTTTDFMGLGVLIGFGIVSINNKIADNLLYTHFFTLNSGLIIILWSVQKMAMRYAKELSNETESQESFGSIFHSKRKGGHVKILHTIHITMLIFGTLLVFDSSDYIFSSSPLLGNDITLIQNPIKTFGAVSSMFISLILSALIHTFILLLVRKYPD